MAKPPNDPIEAAAQRLRRWRRSPLLLKRLPGGTRIHVIKRIDHEVYKLITEEDMVRAFKTLAKANKWNRKKKAKKRTSLAQNSSTSTPPSAP